MNYFCTCIIPILPHLGLWDNIEQAFTSSQKHVKRPMNPFIIWSSEKRKIIAKENPKMQNAQISKQLGEKWKALPPEEKQIFIDRASRLREEHRKQYPNYKFCRRKTKWEDARESVNPELVPPNYSHPNLCIGYINGCLFYGYPCGKCLRPIPMFPYFPGMQHPSQYLSLAYYPTFEHTSYCLGGSKYYLWGSKYCQPLQS